MDVISPRGSSRSDPWRRPAVGQMKFAQTYCVLLERLICSPHSTQNRRQACWTERGLTMYCLPHNKRRWRTWALLVTSCSIAAAAIPLAHGGTPVFTRAYDNGRTGSNTSEVALTPQLIQTKGMKLLKSLKVDDDPRLEAQPLYVPGLKLADGSLHNVVFVATMANQVWAFDLDAPTGHDLLWKTSLGAPFVPIAGIQRGGRCVQGPAGPLDHRCTDTDWWGINVDWGILATPVVDADTNTMYVANWVLGKDKKPALFLHHVRLRDGKELQPPRPITGTLLGLDGKPINDERGNPIVLHSDQKVRAALLLDPLHGRHKTIFIATTGGENPGDPHGWVVSFDADTFHETSSWISTPSSFGGGLWQGGQGLSSDEAGNVYGMTGNGGFGADNAGRVRDFEGDTDFAEAFIKLKYNRSGNGVGTLSLADWFIPFRDSERSNTGHYNYQDQDLGSAAPVVPPGRDVVLGAGKDGLLYVLDRAHFGQKVGDLSVLKSPKPDYVTFNGLDVPDSVGPSGRDMDFELGNPTRYPNKTHHVHGSPLYWEGPMGPMLFVWGENESLRAWKFDDQTGTLTFFGRSAEIASAQLASDPKGMGGMTGGMLTLSSNGKVPETGIVWATAPVNGDANHDVVEGRARAYDATRVDPVSIDANTPRLKLLWDSSQSGVTFNFSKFCPPVVADGRLLVTTYDGRVDIYGLNP
jgi:hypothetical protein